MTCVGPPLALVIPFSWRTLMDHCRALAEDPVLLRRSQPFPQLSCEHAEQQFQRYVSEGMPVLIQGCEHVLSDRVPRTWEEAAHVYAEYQQANQRRSLGFGLLQKWFPNNINIWVPQEELGHHIASPAFWSEASREVPGVAAPLERHTMLAKYIVSHRGGFFGTHRDMYRENLEMIITGQKLVIMFPPTAQNYFLSDPRVMHNASFASDTQNAGWPQAEHLQRLEGLHMGLVRSGEMVYVPSDWFHFFVPAVNAPETQTSYCWRRSSLSAEAGRCEHFERLLGQLFHDIEPPSPRSLAPPVADFRDSWQAANRTACPYIRGLAEQLMHRLAWPEAQRRWFRRDILSASPAWSLDMKPT